MLRLCLFLAVIVPLTAATARSGDAKSTKITVILRGAVTPECAEALKKAMKSIEHIRYDEDAIQPGEKGNFGHYFTPRISLELLDLEKTDIGAVAKIVAAAKTSKRDDVPPSLNVILFNPNPFVRGHVVSLRETFGEVPGFESRAKGGTGAFPNEDVLCLRLDDSGVAKISDIRDGLKRGDLPFTLQK